MFASTRVSIDPAWPGAAPSTAWTFLAAAAVMLVGLTLWTYLGVRGTPWRRVLVVLSLRLTALAVTVFLMLRPSFAFEEEDAVAPSRLFVLLDASKSMTVADEFGGKSRFDRARGLLDANAVQSTLQRLAEEKKIETVIFQGASDVKRLDADAQANGSATDIGRWLDELSKEAASDIPVQAMILLSDGIDTLDAARAIKRASDFRGKWPITTLGLGQPTTVDSDKDIVLDQILVEPQPILAKGKFKVKVIAHAPGFEDARTDVSLWLEDRTAKSMVKVKAQAVRFSQPTGNVILFEADAPDTQGEIKITVKSKAIDGETSTLNNEISTFAYVSKEGVRILWIEGKKRAYEAVFAIRYALAKDRRLNVVYVERAGADEAEVDPYKLDQTAYDVVVIGDVSAARFGDPGTHRKILERVQSQGMGLVMLGGYESFSGGNWQTSPLAQLLPAKLDRIGQVDEKIRVSPTLAGLDYLCRLADDPVRNKDIWTKQFAPLDGMSQMGVRDPRSTVFATLEGDEATPILLGAVRGKGRVLAFAGDTTWKAWRRTPDAIAGYERFWRQMMLWLAQQEQSQGAVFAELDSRRMDRPRQLAYRVGFRGVEAVNAKFTAKIVGPRGESYSLPIATDQRGIWTPPTSGEFTFQVEGKATTPGGQPIEGKDSARFLVFETDREMLRLAADHDLLEKLAAASDGRFSRADERSLLQTLEELAGRQAVAEVRVSHWPDWRRNPPTESVSDQIATLWRSTALGALGIYIACLCLEWYLRRRWGMV